MPRKARSKKIKSINEEINEAAEAAAQIEEMETLGDDLEEMPTHSSFSRSFRQGPEEEDYAEDDVFEEAFKKAVALNTAPRFHIKKNSQFLAVKGWPYSWEQLQKEYGEGYYQVIAKSMANGRILKKQSEMVGNPSGQLPIESHNDDEKTGPSEIAWMSMLQQFQERADQKAQELAKQSEGSLSTLMQTMMSLQQQQTQAQTQNMMTMMTMMQESNKQFQNLLLSMNQKKDDPIQAAFLNFVLQKPKDEGNLKPIDVWKMTKEAERDAEARTKLMYELIDKKANALAEIKAEAMVNGDGEDEGGFKGLIKGFVPVLTQMIQQQQAGGVNPQLPQAQVQVPRLQTPQAQQAALDELALRPIGAQQRRGPAPQNPPRRIRINPQGANMTQAMPQKLDEEKKAQVFDFVSGDIGNALMNRVNASKTAEVVLQKLEKVGWARQTISDSYSLEDFYGYAAKYGLPDAVKPWLEEFHLAIKNSSNVKPVHESAERTSGSLFIPTTVTVNGTNGSTAKASEPVAEG